MGSSLWDARREMHTCEVHAHETHAREMHAHEMHAHEMHACEICAYKMHTHKIQAHDTRAYEVYPHEMHVHEMHAYEMYDDKVHAHEIYAHRSVAFSLGMKCKCQRTLSGNLTLGPITSGIPKDQKVLCKLEIYSLRLYILLVLELCPPASTVLDFGLG
jgi:hypothetical protein